MAEKEKKDRAGKMMGGAKKSSKKKSKHPVHEMTIRRTANKKFIAQHRFKPTDTEAPEMEEHSVGSPEELAAHVQDHFSQQPEEPAQQAQAAPPSPASVLG